MQSVLFITRKLRGRGGMQQYTKDLWRGLQEVYGERVALLGPRTFLGLLFLPLLAFFRGVSVARKGGVVHLGDAALFPFASLIKMFVPRARITATVHGLDVIHPAKMYQWVLRRSALSIDRFVCVSHATADALEERGVSRDHITIIPCGVWMDDHHASHERREEGIHLVSIGRLIPRKGIFWFVSNVLPLLLLEHPNLSYTIVGTGPQGWLIKKFVQVKGLSEAVSLRGHLTDEERNQLLSEADLLVVPNVPVEWDMEGFGIVCIEASSMGVPVVASRLEGLQDAVVEGETGTFFKPQDSEDCVRAIRSLRENPLDRHHVIQATADRYNWKQLIRRYKHEVFSV